MNALLTTARALLEAREDQMVTAAEWDALRDAVAAADPAESNYEPDSCGAVDRAAFEKAIRENLAPEGVAMTIAYLRSASSVGWTSKETEAGGNALRQVRWLADTLFEMLGEREYNRLVEEIGL